MLGKRSLIAFIGASDREAAKRFYRDVLGLRMTEENPFTVEFDAGGTMLRVTFVREVTAAPYTVLGWTVPDISSTLSDLVEKGVGFERFDGIEQDVTGVWTAPGGAKIAWFRDPDGNLLSLTEWPAS